MSHLIQIFPSNISFEGDQENTLLDSALNSGIHLEHSCRNGSCGICEAELIVGEVANEQGDIISAGNKILTCSCRPCGDVTLNATYYPELAGQVKKIMPAKISSAELVSSDVIKLTFRLPPSTSFSYLPGQYINLHFQGIVRSYSIANANENEGIELHIRNVPDGAMSKLIFRDEIIPVNTLMRIEGPCGTFFIRKSSRPVIFIAGGTGFAPVKSMVEQLIQQQSKRDIYVYWGGANSDSFYSQLPARWAEIYSNIHFVPVVSGNEEAWSGRKGLVHNAVIDDFANLEEFDVYACGSPLMIDACRKDFSSLNLSAKNFYSDAFTVSK
ncbi:2Fe-2S iron-sulfur cluster binding domain-containing protein [Citrobacter sp. ku-bf4]|uniref:FAD-binding oxidoreductase n=1 Tax=Citrobacter TaxID=544 RepID=UPI00197F3A97|nr:MULTISPECIES: FAD-binding oxidoreductase [Citrobacter]MBN6046135.1 2Fe-2S iron-sulfur cluster binding domain-containing protein [Citrobacter sp. ku-bf4]MBS0827651.1 2Fe-2S iron-sulfur cluster binding domain-containing protein [Citrobacter amalonaticus]